MRTIQKTLTAAAALSLCASLTTQAAGSPVSKQQPVAAPVSAPAIPPPAVKSAAPKSEKPSDVPLSALERFRTYTGQRTPAALCELFNAPASAGFRQQPEVVISNGALTVSITAALPASDNAAPNIAFNGARLMSYERGSKDKWLIDALPDTGVMKAEMIVLSNNTALEFPLAVAPPLPVGTDLSEKAFTAFLGGSTPAGKPVLDLNGDGRRDYQDDYIFAANYLVNKRSASSTAVGAEEPRVMQRWEQQQTAPAAPYPDSQAAGTTRSADPATPAAPGSEQVSPSAGGGWYNNTPAPSAAPAAASGNNNSNNTGSADTNGTSTTAGNNNGTSNGTNQNTSNPTPESGTMTTLTSPSGKTVTFIGSDRNNLNKRNLDAKERTNNLNQTPK